MPQQTKAHFTATKIECWHDGRATDLIQRLKGREVLVRRFCYRGKLMLSALTEKLVRGRK